MVFHLVFDLVKSWKETPIQQIQIIQPDQPDGQALVLQNADQGQYHKDFVDCQGFLFLLSVALMAFFIIYLDNLIELDSGLLRLFYMLKDFIPICIMSSVLPIFFYVTNKDLRHYIVNLFPDLDSLIIIE